MLSVAVHKDVGEYQPKIVGGLTFRSFICVVLAMTLSCGLGLCSWFVFGASMDFVVYVTPLLTFPIWAVGFWRPKGMAAEKFLPLWVVHMFTRNVLLYRSSMLPSIKQLNKEEEKKGRARRRHIRACEAYEPMQGLVSVSSSCSKGDYGGKK